MTDEGAGLEGLDLKPEYRSDEDDLLRDLYIPCLRRSAVYKRAVGYFTSGGLAAAATGLAALINSGGHMLLVASPFFDEDDLDAMRRGYRSREDATEKALLRALAHTGDELVLNRLGYLAWLIADMRLEIRVAVPVDESGGVRTGIYHEKQGTFEDGAGNRVAFSGSSNETVGGLLGNFEAVDVFWSWDDPQGRVSRKVLNFDRLWNGKTRGLCVKPLPEAAREGLLKYKPRAEPRLVPLKRSSQRFGDVALWDHQQEAVDAFLRAKCGILEMATGSGKTHVALYIINRLIEDGRVHSIVVSCDGTDLLNQWWREILASLVAVSPRFRLFRHFAEYHERDEFLLTPHQSLLLCSRSSLAPLFGQLDEGDKRGILLILDEVHGLGSPSNVAALNGAFDPVPYRLGLSATPERTYDEVGNQFLLRNVGPVLYQFSLKDAIERGILCEFDYFPIRWQPNEDDRRRLQTVYKRKALREAEGRPMSEAELWTELARVYKTSEVKLPLFAGFLQSHPKTLERCIIFVAEKSYGRAVFEHVHALTHRFHTYFDSDDGSILQAFAAGDIDCLITCHRVSEGIDIRSVSTIALLSSDRSRLETIQRIGRCLRIDPETPGKRATVVDFIRSAGDQSSPAPPDEQREQWLSDLASTRKRGEPVNG